MKLFLILFLLLSIDLSAQSGIVATGTEANGTGGSMSYTVGQIDYKYLSGSNGSMNQGIQQPYEFFTVGVDNHPEITLEMTIYPNPTLGDLQLHVTSLIGEMNYILFDENGKVVMNETIQELETMIDLTNLPRSSYYLKVLQGTAELKVFKVIKN